LGHLESVLGGALRPSHDASATGVVPQAHWSHNGSHEAVPRSAFALRPARGQGDPSPEEEMLPTIRNRFHVWYREIGRLKLVVSFRTQYGRRPFVLWQGIEIKSFLWNGWTKRDIPFQISLTRRSSTTIRHCEVNIQSFQSTALNMLDHYWPSKTDKSPLRRYGSLVGFIVNQPEQTAEYHEYARENASPQAWIQNLLKHAVILGAFAIGASAYIFGIICIWHSLDSGKHRFLLLAGLLFILGWYATKYVFDLTHNTYQFLDTPNVVCYARLHRRSDAQSLVNAAEVVVHVVKRDGATVIFQLLGERTG
jgi:hypothetical protein